MFFLLVSDPIVTQTCLSVSDIFFVFSIDFVEAYPHHYTPIRCCAQRLGPHYPPYTIRVAQNTKMTKPYTSASNVFLMQQVLKSWALVWTRVQLSCFFIIRATKKCEQKHANNYCLNWALVRTRARFWPFWGTRKWASKSTLNTKVTACDPNIFPKMRQDFTKSSKMLARTATDMQIK